MASTAVSVLAQDAPREDCESQGFENVYYLIDKNDIFSASVFYHSFPVLSPNKEAGFLSLTGQRERISTYYDFDDLAILNENKELMSILDSNLPIYFDEREQVNYIDSLTKPQSIIKFEVKNYNKNISSLDKHLLFGRIKRKERPILIKTLSAISKDSPESISESLKIKSTENIHLITLYGISYGVITISHFTILDFGVPNTAFLLKIEKNHDRQNKLTIQERKYLDSILCRIDNKFQFQFPHVKSFSWFGYAQYNKLAVDNLASRAFFLKHPEIYSLGQIICLSLIGFLIIYLVLGRYSKSASYRIVSKKHQK